MRFRLPALAFALLGLAAAAPADDLGSAEPVAEPTPASEPEPAADPNAIRLSLADAIELALENNLDVEAQRFAPLISGELETEAWGAYDPELFAEFGYSAIKNPSAFALDGTTESINRSTDGFGGFRGLLPYLGSSYNFQFDGQRTTTNSVIQQLSPELRSSFSLSLTQPLLRGLIWNEPWTRIKTSRVLYDESLEDFRRQVMDTVQAVEDEYWNVVATEEQRGVARKSLETAKALLGQTETQYEVGVVSKVEVVEAEAGVADREFNLIRAQNLYESAQDRLLNLIFGSEFGADSKRTVAPTDRPDDYITYDIDAEEATRRAFENRPELAIADDEIERRKLELKFAKNQRLPQFNVELSYGNRGLAGEQNPDHDPCRFSPDPACVPVFAPTTDFEDSLDDFIEQDSSDQFAARAIFSIPIPNTAPRAGVSRAELELRRATVQKRREEQRIILEVRKAVRDLESAQEGIEAARRAAAAAAEQLRAERIRLEYGESTPFDVLLREEDFVEAESQEIGAYQLYRTSVTGLDRAQGTILSGRNIVIEDVSAVR